jgi:transposase-like protein
MRMWFDAWNEDNRRAREEYYFTRTLQELCQRKLHHTGKPGLLTSDGRCVQCRKQSRRTREYMRRRGIALADLEPMRMRRLTEEQAAEVVRMYAETFASARQIGKLFGVSHTTIRRTLQRAGVQMRSPSTVRRYVMQQAKQNNHQPGDETDV